MFKVNPLYLTDGYKIGHKKMLAPNTTKLYGTWIPRSTKYAPNGVKKIVSFGQQLTWRWIHDEFEENFFKQPIEKVLDFQKDMCEYLGMDYDASHFKELHELGYLPIKVKSLTEGVETNPNIPHMTFVNTVDGFAWLTLYLETIVSSLSWKTSTCATIALQYKRNVVEWVNKTAKDQSFLIPFMCHNFSARGMSPFDMIASALGHDVAFMGDDTLVAIPASRYFYGETEMPINSVNASEHSVSTTKIFTVGEKQMLSDWMKEFPTGILSVVSDTFDLWKLITEYLPELKEQILARDGKLVIRPDSGDPVDIICGEVKECVSEIQNFDTKDLYRPKDKGVIELLWDIFGGTINEQGYKVLDSHIGAIYGDSITLDRQVEIYERLEAKGFAATNIILGVGSFTYQFNTRDTFGFAAKGSWFEVENSPNEGEINDYRQKVGYDIYKDPITDGGTKKSLKGFQAVFLDDNLDYYVVSECDPATESKGELRLIYEDGKFFNQTTLTEVRHRIDKLI